MKREEKKQQKLIKIYEAAMELFREIGYEKATVEKIAAKAGVAKGSFFNYFETKDHVLLYASDLQIKRVAQLVEQKKQQEGTVKELIKQLFTDLLSTVEWTRPLEFAMFQSSLSNPYFRDSYIKKLAEVIMPLLEKGYRQEELTSDFSLDLLSKMLIHNYFAALFNWSTEQSDRSIVEEVNITIDLFFAGASRR